MSKVVFDFDPFEMAGVEPPKSKKVRTEAMEEMAEFVRTQAILHMGDGRSPVQGGQWKRSLSKEYRARKEAQGGEGFANLELTGELMDAVDCYPKSATKLHFGVEGDQAPKADGHNNHSGKSELPPREFVPREGGTFKRQIVSGLRQIALDYAEDED